MREALLEQRGGLLLLVGLSLTLITLSVYVERGQWLLPYRILFEVHQPLAEGVQVGLRWDRKVSINMGTPHGTYNK